jgi:hypothetical protein
VAFVTDLGVGRTGYTIWDGKLEENVTPLDNIKLDL